MHRFTCGIQEMANWTGKSTTQSGGSVGYWGREKKKLYIYNSGFGGFFLFFFFLIWWKSDCYLAAKFDNEI